MKQRHIKRYMPDCSIHATAEIAFMRESENGKYVSFDDYDRLNRQYKQAVHLLGNRYSEIIELEAQLFKERHPFLSAASWLRSKLKRGKS